MLCLMELCEIQKYYCFFGDNISIYKETSLWSYGLYQLKKCVDQAQGDGLIKILCQVYNDFYKHQVVLHIQIKAVSLTVDHT